MSSWERLSGKEANTPWEAAWIHTDRGKQMPSADAQAIMLPKCVGPRHRLHRGQVQQETGAMPRRDIRGLLTHYERMGTIIWKEGEHTLGSSLDPHGS